jgi:hypothetical protein
MSARPIVLAAVSDLHCNSKIGLCPKQGVRVGGGARYQPGKAQLWLWDQWLAYWAEVKRILKDTNGELWIVANGDLVDGDHHQTTQIISKNLEHQAYIVKEAFAVPLALKPVRIGIVRGTAAHVGEEGSSEESLARGLAERGHPVIQNRDPEEWSHYVLRIRPHGHLIDCRHHGRTGGRPWTTHGAMGNLSRQIALEHLDAGEEIPDLCLRSHKHNHGDSGEHVRPRVIALPAYQLLTDHAYKVVAEAIADIGGIIAVIRPKEPIQITTLRWRPRLPEAL